jgi:hypothetical protein
MSDFRLSSCQSQPIACTTTNTVFVWTEMKLECKHRRVRVPFVFCVFVREIYDQLAFKAYICGDNKKRKYREDGCAMSWQRGTTVISLCFPSRWTEISSRDSGFPLRWRFRCWSFGLWKPVVWEAVSACQTVWHHTPGDHNLYLWPIHLATHNQLAIREREAYIRLWSPVLWWVF